MWLVPYTQAVLRTDLEADEVRQRLSQLIEREKWISFSAPLPGSFAGRITASGFRAMRTPYGRDPYTPWIIGKITDSPHGCEVHLIFVVYPPVAFIMLALAAGILGIAATHSIWATLIAGALLIAFHALLVEFGFREGALEAESDLSTVLRKTAA